jgi:hypothetical protein
LPLKIIFELRKLWKTHFKVLFNGKNRNLGERGESHVGERIFHTLRYPNSL